MGVNLSTIGILGIDASVSRGRSHTVSQYASIINQFFTDSQLNSSPTPVGQAMILWLKKEGFE